MAALNYCAANRHCISGHSKLLGRPELGQDYLPDIFSANILEAAAYGCANLLASLADEETQPAYYYMIGANPRGRPLGQAQDLPLLISRGLQCAYFVPAYSDKDMLSAMLTRASAAFSSSQTLEPKSLPDASAMLRPMSSMEPLNLLASSADTWLSSSCLTS